MTTSLHEVEHEVEHEKQIIRIPQPFSVQDAAPSFARPQCPEVSHHRTCT